MTRVIAVTGATGGIGRLVTARFLANGDTVIATDTRANALAKLDPHPRLATIAADIANEAGCQAVADMARNKANRVDTLVNVAGSFPVQPFEDMSAEDFRKVIDINLIGTFLMIRAIWPLMKGRGWGRIVSVGSACHSSLIQTCRSGYTATRHSTRPIKPPSTARGPGVIPTIPSSNTVNLRRVAKHGIQRPGPPPPR